MFSFIKKADKSDKERRKKEKIRPDVATAATPISADELLRLDEIRRSLKIRTKRKEKDKLPSGITADYSEFFANLTVNHRPGEDATSVAGPSSLNKSADSIPQAEFADKRISYSDSSETSLYSLGKATISNGTVHNGTASLPSPSNPVSDFEPNHVKPPNAIGLQNGNSLRPPDTSPLINDHRGSFKNIAIINHTGEAQGNSYWTRFQTFDAAEPVLPLPAIRVAALPPPREILITRQKTSRADFGFSLRNAVRMDLHAVSAANAAQIRPTIFAEPGTGGETIGLMPGDRLLGVNGKSVESLNREDIIEMIRNSSESVTVNVQPVPELAELYRRCLPDAVATTHLTDGKCLSDADQPDNAANTQIWLLHSKGFTAATKLAVTATQDQMLVKLSTDAGEQITVDCEQVVNANPSALDLTEDVCRLKHLNEASILHCLRQRYANNLIHTMVGDSMIIMNPMGPLSLYSDKIAAMFHGCKFDDMPPHIYSMAQRAYKKLIDNRRDQSIIFTGRSGSGKTTNFKHALFYLSLAAGSTNGILSIAKINAITNILESFGNLKTSLNKNATRFTQIFRLEIDQYGVIVSSSVQMMLLEKNRIKCLEEFDQTFPVFVQLLAGADEKLRRDLHLDIDLQSENMFVRTTTNLEENQKHALEFLKLLESFQELKFDKESVQAVWNLIGAIVHLGYAGLTNVENQMQFAKPISAQHAAKLLGIPMEQLTSSIFPPITSATSSDTHLQTCYDNLDHFVVGIYSIVITSVLAIINNRISTHSHAINSILLIDSPGFQNPSSAGISAAASLSDLGHNYLQERLQMLFFQDKLIAPQTRYTQELVKVNAENVDEKNPSALIALLDKQPQGGRFRKLNQRLRDEDRCGLFRLLEEESMYKKSDESAFLDCMQAHYNDSEFQALIQRSERPAEFYLQHLNGTNPVLYSTRGWFKQNKPNSSIANQIIQMSNSSGITKLVSNTFGREMNFTSNILSNERNTQTIRRMSSIRQSSAGGSNRISTMMQVKFTVDTIIDTLRRTEMHFITCLLPHHTSAESSVYLNNGVENIVNVPLLRSQIRGSHLFEAARLYRQGFPESLTHFEFIRKFNLLGSEFESDKRIEHILLNNDVVSSSYRIGPSQVLLRSGILHQLERKRDERLSGRIILFQAVCRGFLERKKLAQRRIQELAVRCIQKNVRVFFSVRNWPWWRLLVRVTPLIRTTEDLLKVTNEEMLMLKQKLEKVEAEKNALKSENIQLHYQLSELGADYNEERTASQMTNERLETETTERIALFDKLEQQEQKLKHLQEYNDKLELDLISAKSDLNGFYEYNNDDDNDESKNMYKLKLDRTLKELEFTKKRFQTQHEHDLDQLIVLKKQMGSKLTDAFEEVEEQKQVVNHWKQKMQKTASEINDLRMLLDEHTARNCILEKRQRKFDADYQMLQETTRQDNFIKERLIRDKDNLVSEKYSLEQQLIDAKQNIDSKDEQITALKRDMEELSCSELSEEQITQLKRSKMDTERLCKEQEEELDDMAGQIQLLQQSKQRLEINLETMRKESRKESQQRDEELEEVRGSFLKKIKALECQLEVEHEERTLLLREKNELDRRLHARDQQDQADRGQAEAINAKLKKDLRKSKALLKDALAQLDKAKADAPKKQLIRQLKNELEDAENERKLAVKMRQTLEADIADMQTSLDESNRMRSEAEDRANQFFREKSELQTQIEESEEELAELMRKYTSTVKLLNAEQLKISDCEIKISEMEFEANALRERITELNLKLESLEQHTDPVDTVQTKRLAYRANELESRLELEQALRVRVEVQCNRHKENVEKLQNELIQNKSKEMQTIDQTKQLQKTLRELNENIKEFAHREQDLQKQVHEKEKLLERTTFDHNCDKNDLQLALQRIADLQYALQSDEEDDLTSETSSLADSDPESFVEDNA